MDKLETVLERVRGLSEREQDYYQDPSFASFTERFLDRHPAYDIDLHVEQILPAEKQKKKKNNRSRKRVYTWPFCEVARSANYFFGVLQATIPVMADTLEGNKELLVTKKSDLNTLAYKGSDQFVWPDKFLSSISNRLASMRQKIGIYLEDNVFPTYVRLLDHVLRDPKVMKKWGPLTYRNDIRQKQTRW